MNAQALFLELFCGFLCNVPVRHEQEVVQRLEHRHLGTEPAPDAAEFEPDDTAAHDAEGSRYRIEFERAPGIDDSVAVERRDAEFDRYRATGEDDVTRIEDLDLAFDGREFHFPVSEQAAMPGEAGDLICLEQPGDAGGQLAHDAVLAFLHLCDIDFDAARVDAVLAELVMCPVIKLG